MNRRGRFATLLLAGLLAALPTSARAATNAVLGGLGGVANGSLGNGDGTGAARIEVNGTRLALVKQVRDAAGAVLSSGANVAPGQELYFVLWVDNPTAFPAEDVRIEDVLDETQFEYVPGTLQETVVPSGAGDSGIWAGPWTALTDVLGAPDDAASFVEGGGAVTRRLTLGAVAGQPNHAASVPAGTLLALRFRVRVSAITVDPALSNSATGTLGGVPLDTSAASLGLVRVGGAVSSALAEINPQDLLVGSSGNRLTYHLLPTIAAADSGVSRVEITLPAGLANVAVTGVAVAGVPLAGNCAGPGAGEYCAQVAPALATIELGVPVTTDSAGIRVDLQADAPPTAQTLSFPSALGYSGLVTPATPGDADGNPATSNGIDVTVVDSQGLVLRVEHVAGKSQALVGEVVPFAVPVRNLTAAAVDSVRIDAAIPPGFDYLPGSARIDGTPAPDPARAGPELVFPLGDVPGLVDANGNGQADPGEAGYRALTYQLIVGSGTEPGVYVSTAVAKDYCASCVISNESEAGITLASDPDFELATILGKVFHDRNGDGWQDPDEEGVGGARVALDDGTYVTTDRYGRYHFPVITPGHRVVKIDHGHSGRASESTTDEALVIRVTPGLVAKANFGVRVASREEAIGDDGTEALALVREAGDNAISLVGNVHGPSLVVNGTAVPLPVLGVEMRQNGRTGVLEVGRAGRAAPGDFALAVEAPAAVARWSLTVWDSRGSVLRRFEGDGEPPSTVAWRGDGSGGLPVPDGGGTYQFEVHLADSTHATSPRRLFAVETAAGTAAPDPFRMSPAVSVNGVPLPVGALGRFADEVDDLSVRSLRVALSDSLGQSVTTEISFPHLEILEAAEVRVLPRETVDESWLTGASGEGATAPPARPLALATGLAGRTDPRNLVEVNGIPLPVAPDGAIDAEVPLTSLRNNLRILIRNPEGYSRVVNLFVDVRSKDDRGREWRYDPTPNLRVELPPEGVALRDPRLVVRGSTSPGNVVGINGESADVDSSGAFSTAVELPPGTSRLVVDVTDPEGNRGSIEREVEVAPTDLLLLAFADGKFGQMQADGNFRAAGIDDADRFYAQGRVAYYLKGRIAGKYLITSALDTGFGELDEIFRDLGPDETRRLFRNLDPDKTYSVYGDDSSVVYDTESQGKFYLALEGDELDVLVGNYALDLAGPELATYQRTLFGGRATWRSVSETRYGDPNTRVIVFGAEVRLVHVRNEMRGTGGSVYYLRHDDVAEGSEQVTLVVRDKNTGLQLSRERQRRNVDYTVKYPEGRVTFRRPIQSVVLDGMVVNEAIQPGHPVWIEVDYEARLETFEKAGGGARARQQIGDHVALGATYVDDEQAGAAYELRGVDSEIRLGEGTRVTAEYAESEGADARTFVSQDGGLTFEESTPAGGTSGTAWRVGADVDVGEWFERPDRLRIAGYYKDIEAGFASNGNFLERGTEKAGAQAELKVGERNLVALRHGRERRTGLTIAPGGLSRTDVTSAQWDHRRDRVDLSVEYFGRNGEDDAGNDLDARQYAAGRVVARVTERLEARAGYQQTLSGESNDQASAGLQYKLLRVLSLDLQGVSGSRGTSAQAGAIVEAGRTRVYASERRSDDGAGRGATTVLGAQTPLDSSSRVYTEYQWDRQDAGDRTVSSLGLQKNWDPSPGLRLVTGGEISDVDSDTEDASRASVAASVSYERPSRLKLWSHNEIRYQEGTANLDQYLTSNRAELRLWPSFPLLGVYRWSRTEDRETGALQAWYREASVGLAYRPVANDRWNGMARYTRLADKRPDEGLGLSSLARRLDVLSAEAVYDMHRRVEWSGKAAGRVLDERFPESGWRKTHTTLGILRVDLGVRPPVDLGIEYRALHQREADDTKQGWVLELSRKFGRHLRLGAGYSFTDVSDDELSSNDYSVRGWYLRFQGKH